MSIEKQQEEFMHHHRRSNSESTFSMLKANSQKNEVSAKVLFRNVCCVIQNDDELGIDVDFRQE